MTYDAGQARAVYSLDIAGLRRSVDEAKRLYTELRKAEQDALTRRSAPANGASARTSDEVKLQQALARTASAEARKAAEANKAAQIDQRAGEAAARQALFEQRRQSELARTAQAEARAAQSALRLEQARERASRNGGRGPALPRTFAGFEGAGGFLQFAGGVAGGLGLAVGAQQAIAGAIDAGKAALELQRVQALTRAIAGDQSTYNNIVAEARKQQELYGGSLADNVQKLSGLAIVSRSSGAQLSSLIDLSQRLAVLDPAQGLEGAQIALREALSGDTRSLALRFEVPRSALVKLKDETIPVAERLQVIDDYLNKIGITSETVSGTISDQAKAFNRLNAELDTLKTNAGQGLADAFTPAATGLARLVGLINDNPQAIAELRALLGGRGSVSAEDVAQAARDVQQRRLGGDQAAGFRLTENRNAAQGGIFGSSPEFERVKEQYRAASQQAIQLAASSEEAAASVARVTREYAQTGDLERYRGQLDLIAQAQAATLAPTGTPPYLTYLRDGAPAAQQLAGAIQALSAEQQKTFKEQAEGEATALRLKDAQAALAADSALAARGLLGAGDQALILANKYGIAKDAAELLINAQQRISNGAALADQRAGERDGGSSRTQAEVTRDANTQRELARRQREAEAARQNQILQTGTATQRTAILQQRYNEAVARFGKNSAEAINAETALLEARKAGGRQRVDQVALTADRIENREEDLAIKLLQIQEDYQLRARRSQEDFDVDRTRAEEDFARKKRRLLAEGKIFEAQQAQQEFDREQARNLEDFQRQQSRAQEDARRSQDRQASDAGLDVSRIQDRAALRGVVVGSSAPRPPIGEAVPLAPADVARPVAAASFGTVRLEFAPISLLLDGNTVAQVTYPLIEQRLVDDLTVIQVAAPVGNSVTGGPRP